MSIVAIVIAVIVGAAVAYCLFKPCFGDRDGFLNCVKFWLTPDIVSMFRGQYGEDWVAQTKLGAWIGASVLCGWGTHAGLMKLFG